MIISCLPIAGDCPRTYTNCMVPGSESASYGLNEGFTKESCTVNKYEYQEYQLTVDININLRTNK